MVYFPSGEELRYVHRGLLAEAREHPVANELRGWSWARPPLRAIYARPLEAEDVASGTCPTGRDLYLSEEFGEPRRVPAAEADGDMLKAALARVVIEAKALIGRYGPDSLDQLERLAQRAFAETNHTWGRSHEDDQIRACLWRIRAFEARRILERVADAVLTLGQIGGDALAALAVPIHVDLPLNGGFLGLSDRVVADAISFRDGTVFSVRVGPPNERHRLVTTGVALVAESVFERPMDLGCVVYLVVNERHVELRRDFHVIGDELRQTFVEERDDRMRMLELGADPGMLSECPTVCPYLLTCRPALTAVPARLERPIAATRRAIGSE